MITLRTLKKKSKQAASILRAYYPDDAQGMFLAEKGENYHGLIIRCTHGAGDPDLRGARRRCECSWHPLKGTPMIGGMSGYYEPEWDERTALEALRELVRWGAQPKTMTDREWARTLRITGTRPVTDDEMAEWAREYDEEPAPVGEHAQREDADTAAEAEGCRHGDGHRPAGAMSPVPNGDGPRQRQTGGQ